jgi:hypothetical protein
MHYQGRQDESDAYLQPLTDAECGCPPGKVIENFSTIKANAFI